MTLRTWKQGFAALLLCCLGLITSLAAAQPEVITITLQNVDSSAWVVKSVAGAENVAKLNTENTSITLSVGQRYHFVNLGTVQIHPLALRGQDGDSLLNQRPQDRPFETDPEVDFVADDSGLTFTLTEALAEQVRAYYCTAHPAPLMEALLTATR